VRIHIDASEAAPWPKRSRKREKLGVPVIVTTANNHTHPVFRMRESDPIGDLSVRVLALNRRVAAIHHGLENSVLAFEDSEDFAKCTRAVGCTQAPSDTCNTFMIGDAQKAPFA
jgi:hypothetical protein